MTTTTDILPINWKKGMDSCGCDEKLFMQMLEIFESLSFDSNLKETHDIIMAPEDINCWEVALQMNRMKGPLSYIAADRCLVIACEINQAAWREDRDVIIEKYFALLPEARTLKLFLADVNKRRPDLKEIDRYSKCFLIKNGVTDNILARFSFHMLTESLFSDIVQEVRNRYFKNAPKGNVIYETDELGAKRSACQNNCNQF